VNEDDDIVNKIKAAFGTKLKKANGYKIGNLNTHYIGPDDLMTAPSLYNNGVI
jgi:hypothetical protein